MLVIIKDISHFLQAHLKLIDKMYQDAVEANFSHEYMTPLNSIIGNTNMTRSNLKMIYKQVGLIGNSSPNAAEAAIKILENYEFNMDLIRNVQESAILMLFHNKNQINRMKISKNEFAEKRTCIKFPELMIEKVMFPFIASMKNKGIKAFVAWESD